MSEVERITARLREIAEQLRSPELADEDAESLAREAADLLGKASGEIERALRDAAGDGE